jgi:hypothetical protein
MVENKETNAAVKRHEGEQPSEVMVDNTAILVGERPKTEDICYGFIAIICDDIGARLHTVCRAGVGWDDVGCKKEARLGALFVGWVPAELLFHSSVLVVCFRFRDAGISCDPWLWPN